MLSHTLYVAGEGGADVVGVHLPSIRYMLLAYATYAAGEGGADVVGVNLLSIRYMLLSIRVHLLSIRYVCGRRGRCGCSGCRGRCCQEVCVSYIAYAAAYVAYA